MNMKMETHQSGFQEAVMNEFLIDQRSQID